MKNRKHIFLLLLVVMVLFIAGCSSNKLLDYASSDSYDGVEGVAVAPSAPIPSFEVGGIDSDFFYDYRDYAKEDSGGTVEEKLITSIRLEMETKEYEQTISALEKSVLDMGGYIQSSNVPKHASNVKNSGLTANFHFMVPTSKIEEFLNMTEGLGSVTNINRNVENVTDVYLDTEAHINNLELKEQRLIELLNESGSLSELLQIEDKLSSTRYEIERYKSAIQNYDKRIDYTEIRVTVREVYIYTPKTQNQTIWERISSEFNNSLGNFKTAMEDLFVWTAGVLPFIIIRVLIFLLPFGIIFMVIKKIRRRFKKKSRKEANSTQEVDDTGEDK